MEDIDLLDEETELEEEEVIEEPEPKEIVVKKEGKPNSTRKMPPMTKALELEIFKSLAYKSYKDVGYDFGFQHFYENDKLITAAVFAIARKIRKAPELWGISSDAVEVIEDALASRSVKNNPKIKSDIAIMEEGFRDRLDTMRDKVADIIMLKIAEYEKKGGHKLVSIRDLKDLLAMAIDKGRLLRGETTDNIVRLAKIDADSLSPEEALKVIMKAREALVESKK